MQSNRRGQAQSALQAVQGRHEAIQKIERQMVELAQLFQDMEAAVIEQEPAVMDIEQKGEETVTNLGQGNKQLDSAVDKARAARKKKWICLGISGTFPCLSEWVDICGERRADNWGYSTHRHSHPSYHRDCAGCDKVSPV